MKYFKVINISRQIHSKPPYIDPMKSGYFIRRNRRAFSLIEVTLAMGILAFAIIPLFGLLTIGLNTNRTNIDRSIKAQIVSWTQADVRTHTNAYSANFDEFGVITTDPQSDYLANITPRSIPLPGGSQAVPSWDVVICHQAAGNRIIENKTVWGSL